VSEQVLLVEDDEDLGGAVQDALEQEGFSVQRARDGREALQRLRGDPRPRLVLLDLTMPEMNGWEVMREVELDPLLPELQIVVTTASKAAPSGVTAVLHKPYLPDELIALVRKHAPGRKEPCCA
jgi:CheY-like chemotaxis protein